MLIVCFKTMETDDEGNTTAICGAVQMTGYDPAKHTLRWDRKCNGCGCAGNYDGVGNDWTAETHNGLRAVNSHVKPIREL